MQERWNVGKAWDWYKAQPWPVGCNYVTSTAANAIEMWQESSFDPETIDRELGWAEDLGFNTVRIFLNYTAWESDPDGMKTRLSRFLELAFAHGITAMPVFFTEGGNYSPTRDEIRMGKQPAPIPGVHNSRWVSSPPLSMIRDKALWHHFGAFVADIIAGFRNDRRIIVWDLYNEPGNSRTLPADVSMSLVEAVFNWARGADPSQPITVGGWTEKWQAFAELSDVVSFHSYCRPDVLMRQLEAVKEAGRPVLLTEWMARTLGSVFDPILGRLKKDGVGSYNWGLVPGKLQTNYPWGSKEGGPEPELWFHDILRSDGTPFSKTEKDYIISVTKGRCG